MSGFLFYTTMVLFVIVCLFLVLLILIQKGRGGGLASAFGGAGGNTAFGSKTGDVLTWATSIVFGVFIVLAVALNLISNHRNAPNTQVAAPPAAVPAGPILPASPEIPASPELPATPAPALPASPELPTTTQPVEK